MKENLIKNKIIKQAIQLGFDFEQFTNDADLEVVSEALMDFFNQNSDKLQQIEDKCEVISIGRTQHVSYKDFRSDGEIVNFSDHWHKSPETKVFHSDFVMEDDDGLMKNMNLYYLVGETDYNATDGYYYSKSEKRHVKDL